jgi:hypothetical protein
VRIPGGLHAGPVKLRLLGRDADGGDSSLATTIVIGDGGGEDISGDPGPTSLSALADEVAGIATYDGVTLRMGAERAQAFRDNDFRLSGRAETTVHVVRH